MGCDSKGCGCGGPQPTVKEGRRLFVTYPKRVDKGWGYELHIHNDDGYCGKVLHFNEGARFSCHYHVEKKETWFVAKGLLVLTGIDPDTAEEYDIHLKAGDIIEVDRGIAHQLYATVESDIFEVSTPDKPEDSYRIFKGDSQK